MRIYHVNLNRRLYNDAFLLLKYAFLVKKTKKQLINVESLKDQLTSKSVTFLKVGLKKPRCNLKLKIRKKEN